MTAKERAAVVELLRCAADVAISGDRGAALGCAAYHLDAIFISPLADRHWVSLLRGGGPVHDHPTRGWRICGEGYEFCLLEAAYLVESGAWPQQGGGE